ncbi:UNVERIFIED_CONTAM: hypothetical protein FKN15_026803 [Acipenser sinensis]
MPASHTLVPAHRPLETTVSVIREHSKGAEHIYISTLKGAAPCYPRIMTRLLTLCLLGPQEMLAIMKSIYDMMGNYTYPSVREDTPFEHVEKFFQVWWLHCGSAV